MSVFEHSYVHMFLLEQVKMLHQSFPIVVFSYDIINLMDFF